MTKDEYITAIEEMREDLVEVARYHCAVEADAEDAVQEAIVYLLSPILNDKGEPTGRVPLDSYDETKSAFKTWVIMIVKNRARNITETVNRRKEYEDEPEGFDDTVEPKMEQVTWEESRGVFRSAWVYPRRAQRRLPDTSEPYYDPTDETRLAVRAALDQLPDDEREAVKAVLMEGLTEEEYAAEVGVSQPTVNRMVTRGKERLRGLLS